MRTRPLRSKLYKYTNSPWEERDNPPGPLLVRIPLSHGPSLVIHVKHIDRRAHSLQVINCILLLWGHSDSPQNSSIKQTLQVYFIPHSISKSRQWVIDIYGNRCQLLLISFKTVVINPKSWGTKAHETASSLCLPERDMKTKSISLFQCQIPPKVRAYFKPRRRKL